MDKKIRDAFDQLYMGDECVDRIEKELCKPRHEKWYTSEAAAPSRRSWLKAAAALAAVLAVVLCLGMLKDEYREAQSTNNVQDAPEEVYQQERENLELELIYQEAQRNITEGLRYTEGCIAYSYSGWGNDLRCSALYSPGLHTPWTTFVDGRVVFSANGESFDITDRFSETEPFTYIYTDRYYITHYIAIGGTAENPGFIEMCKVCWSTDPAEGDLGGFSINTWNNETDSRYEWEQKAKEIFIPYGVYWTS